MKLKFKISQSTNIHGWILVDKILAELNKYDYTILNSTSSIVEFHDSPWKLMSNIKAIRRLDGGNFEYGLDENSTLVTFNYYRSITWPVIILITLSINLIWQGQYYAPVFFLLFYVIAMVINMAILKDVAKEMLNEILK